MQEPTRTNVPAPESPTLATYHVPDSTSLVEELFKAAGAETPFRPTMTPLARLTCLLDDSSMTAIDLAVGGPDPLPAVPGYEMLGELGQGGMGVVYLARQVALNRLVALKMLRHVGPAAAAERDRFRREAEAVAALAHPNIVLIHEVGEFQGRPFFSLEFLRGGSLHRRLGGKPVEARQAAAWLEPLARAMHYAHEQGIVHRDLKPGNVLLGTDGTPKVTDFGLAKWVGVDSAHSQDGVVMGTPSYMPPEQAQGHHHDIGPLADVYALGAILYECLTGRPPFLGPTPMHTAAMVLQTDPTPPRRLNESVPRDLETICLKCLEKEPARRYPSAGELGDDLRRFRNGEPVRARPAPAWERGWKWARRRPAAAGLAALSAAVALGLIAAAVALPVYLQGQLALERGKVNAARDARDEAERGERRAVLRADAERLLAAGRAGLAGRDLGAARAAAGQVRDRLAGEPGLDALRAEAERLSADADRARAGKERFEEFLRRREDALYYATTLAADQDVAAYVREARQKARDVLGLYGVSEQEAGTPADNDPYLNDEERRRVHVGCYEMLLGLAEATAQPLPGQRGPERVAQALRALTILDRAEKLPLPPTYALRLRRSTYLKEAGDEVGAEQERKAAAATEPETALDHFLAGQLRYLRGDWREAADHFDAARRSQPEHFWARCLLALSQFQAGKYEAAKAGLTDCLERKPDYTWLYQWRAYAHGLLGEYALAEADFDKALAERQSGPSRYSTYVNRGVVRLRAKRTAEGLADLRHAARWRPDEPQAYLELAEHYRKNNDLKQALGLLDEAARRQEALGRPAGTVYRVRAALHTQRRDADAALADLGRAIAGEPPGGRSRELAFDHVGRGRLLYGKRDFEGALSAFQQAALVRLDLLESADYLFACALTHLQLGRKDADHYRSAERLLDGVLRARGVPEARQADAHQMRAEARLKQKRRDGALEDLTRAVVLRPEARDLRVLRGQEYLNAPEELAVADFTKAIQLDPAKADAYAGRGFAHARLGQAEQAVADAEAAVARLGGLSAPAEKSRLLYQAARVFSLVAAQSEPAKAKPHKAQALDLLGKAFGPLSDQEKADLRERARGDAALYALRGESEFLRLTRP